MPLIYLLILVALVMSVIAVVITKKCNLFVLVYFIFGFVGALVFSLLTFGDTPFLMKYNFINTYSVSILGAGIFVLLALVLNNKFSHDLSRRISKKRLLVFFVVTLVLVFVSPYVFLNNRADFVKKEIDRAGYCEVKNDCVQIVGECPLGCYVHINKNEEERIGSLIDSLNSRCVYGCTAPPEYECLANKCTAIYDKIKDRSDKLIDSFESCVDAGFAVMESYPRRCSSDDQTFVENIGNELEKTDLIRLDYPRPNGEISSPLKISGEARGYWFFEGDFPVVLVNWDGLIIAEGFLSAEDEWMTEDFVRFSGELTFETPGVSNRGALILRKDNPSGLPENDDALEIPVVFASGN